MKKSVLLAVLSVSLLLGCLGNVAAAKPIPQGTNSAYSGYIVSGGKFGINIGDPMESVKPTLTRQKMRDDGFFPCEAYVKEILACSPRETWEIYRVQQFLKDGDVFVKYENNKVAAIAWSFELFPPLDL